MDGTDRALSLLDRLTAEMGSAGEVRDGQRAMCAAVAAAIDTKRHLVVQAGTGTGKSLAYLAPIVASGRKTVIATATKALQDQLADADLPFVAEHGGRPFTFAVLKGRSNYLCRQRLDELDANSSTGAEQKKLPGVATTAPSPSLAKDLATIRTWAATTTVGDRAELTVEPSIGAWAAVSVGPQECPGAAKCPRGDDCFAESARRRAAAADVIVVNTHLYGLHLAAGGMVLPDHDVLVVDEAHELPDIVSATCGTDLGAGRFDNAAATVGGLIADRDLVDSVGRTGAQLTAAIAPMYGERLKKLPEPVQDVLIIGREHLSEAMDAARKIDSRGAPDLATKVARVISAMTSLIGDIDAVIGAGAELVRWVGGTEQSPRLILAPLDVGVSLDSLLWDPPSIGFADEGDPAPGRPDVTIFCSATIPPDFVANTRIPADDVDQLDVGSPFDFEHSALLYCAAHLPPPTSPQYQAAMLDDLEALIRAAGGRTLALFTSYRQMEAAADELATRIPYPVLRQGEAPKAALIERFRNVENSCLFATMSYWQGIDVVGPALSLVTIDRIPFPRPDEPLLAARREALRGEAFTKIDLARASTLLAQGAGRLIRARTDRGVVAVLDSRLATKASYRWQLINALPPMARTKDLSDVRSFFADTPAASPQS